MVGFAPGGGSPAQLNKFFEEPPAPPPPLPTTAALSGQMLALVQASAPPTGSLGVAGFLASRLRARSSNPGAFKVGYTTTPTAGAGNNYTSGFNFGNGPYTMPRDGILQSCSFFLTGSVSGTAQLGIYGNTSSKPGTLLAVTPTFSAVTGWQTVATTTNPTITSGTVIWMGAVDTVSDGTLADANTGFTLYSGASGQTTLQNPFGTATNQGNNFQLGAYATFVSPLGLGASMFAQALLLLRGLSAPSGVLPMSASERLLLSGSASSRGATGLSGLGRFASFSKAAWSGAIGLTAAGRILTRGTSAVAGIVPLLGRTTATAVARALIAVGGLAALLAALRLQFRGATPQTTISAANLTFDANTTNVSSATTASISPGPYKLDIVCVTGSTSNVPTVTGAGGTWVLAASSFDGGGAHGVYMFRDMSASPGSGALTIDFGGVNQSYIGWSVNEFSGADMSGTHGSGAVVQFAGNTSGGATTGITVSLAALGSANNAAVGYLRNNNGGAVTLGSGFTSLSDAHSLGGSNSDLNAEWGVNQTAVAWTWASQTVTSVALAIEIKAARAANISGVLPLTGLQRLASLTKSGLSVAGGATAALLAHAATLLRAGAASSGIVPLLASDRLSSTARAGARGTLGLLGSGRMGTTVKSAVSGIVFILGRSILTARALSTATSSLALLAVARVAFQAKIAGSWAAGITVRSILTARARGLTAGLVSVTSAARIAAQASSRISGAAILLGRAITSITARPGSGFPASVAGRSVLAARALATSALNLSLNAAGRLQARALASSIGALAITARSLLTTASRSLTSGNAAAAAKMALTVLARPALAGLAAIAGRTATLARAAPGSFIFVASLTARLSKTAVARFGPPAGIAAVAARTTVNAFAKALYSSVGTIAIYAALAMKGVARFGPPAGTLNLGKATAALSGFNVTAGGGSGVSATTASISPSANDLVLVSVSSSAAANANAPTLSGAGMTWVQVATAINVTNIQRMTIFRGLSASPGTGVLTIDFAGQSQGHINWSVDEFVGTDITGTNGSGAIAQSQTGLATGTQTGITVNLSAFGSPSNAAYGAVRYNLTSAISAGAGFTALGSSTSGAALESEWQINQTAVAWTWASVSANAEAVAVEIKAPTGGGGARVSLWAASAIGGAIAVAGRSIVTIRSVISANVALALASTPRLAQMARAGASGVLALLGRSITAGTTRAGSAVSAALSATGRIAAQAKAATTGILGITARTAAALWTKSAGTFSSALSTSILGATRLSIVIRAKAIGIVGVAARGALTATTSAGLSFVGLTALAARSILSFTAKASSRGATSVAGRTAMRAVARAQTALTGLTALAGNAIFSIVSRAIPSGRVPITARTTMKTASRAMYASLGFVLLLAHAFVAIFGRATNLTSLHPSPPVRLRGRVSKVIWLKGRVRLGRRVHE